MNATQNYAKDFSDCHVVSPELAQTIKNVRKFSIENNKVFVAAHFKQIMEISNVCVKIPAATAKYLKFVPEHEIIVLNENLSGVNTIRIPKHYAHGDFPRRNEDGTVKPSVIRHFVVKEKDLGKDVPCTIIVKEKNDFLSGEKTIILDFLVQLGKSECDKILRLGVPVLGEEKKIEKEVLIPETNLCIRFEKTETKIMERKKEIEVEKTTKPVVEAKKVTNPVIEEEKPKLQLKKVAKVSSEKIAKPILALKPKLKLIKRS